MKVALTCRYHPGPWGGGNRFVATMVDALRAAGHEPTHELEPGVDVAIMIDPRPRNPQLSFTAGAVLRHLAWRDPRMLVVHRINECDERKGTTGMNRRLRRANYAADHTVFIASWLRDLDVWRREGPHSVIHNGADPLVFHARGFVPWNGDGPLKLVTHHWGAHELKGFDAYRRIDALLDDPAWRGRVELTYIGNAPANASLANVRFLAPLDGEALAEAIRAHHGYISGSINEPGGMHHVEGAMCGLPLLFRRSGALPEYCSDFGIGFDGPDDLPAALSAFIEAYPRLVARMPSYPYSATLTTRRWLELLDALDADSARLVAARRVWRDPLAFFLNQSPF